jgi:hypothetical protein
MLTGTEVRALLAEHYTSEELVDILELEPKDIVQAFDENIEELHDEICQRIREDTGYGETSSDEN